MPSPGEGLRQEREARGKSLEEMAEATGIRPHLLAALEQDAFDSLPGRGFGKLYIRAYAEVLGFDPRPVIEVYDRAVHGRQAAEPTPAPAITPRPLKAMLARWRQERMAGRPEAVLEGTAEVEPWHAAVEQEIAPVGREEPAVQAVPQSTDSAGELIEKAPVPAPPLPVEAVPPSLLTRSLGWLVASCLLFVLLPLTAYLVFLRPATDPPPAAARHELVSGEAIAPTPPRPPHPQATQVPSTPPRAPLTLKHEQGAPSSPEVAESGVGLRLVGTRLEGEGDRFRSGQRVTFSTRVVGGGAGDSIRHVWLRDGKVVQTIGLRLGGASWRTHSTKTLGRPGAWAVEARDDQGRVLARADLTVVP